jgi:hypothetical protein
VISPANVCFYIPPELRDTKLRLFERIADRIKTAGGRITRDCADLEKLPPEIVPIVGCSPQLTDMISTWQLTGRQWIYWDRGYFRRVYATWLPRGANGGYYRWHVNAFQMQQIRPVGEDRWRMADTEVDPWRRDGAHIVVARPSKTYFRFHSLENWTDKIIYDLSLLTDRQLVIRDKESKRPLRDDLKNAHALVTHGSIAAVEAVIMGCPVFVDPSSAAALVGRTDLSKIEAPVYPDREPWLHSLSYCQFNEAELVDGTLWRLMQ